MNISLRKEHKWPDTYQGVQWLIREMEIKTTVKYLIPLRMAILKDTK